MSGRSLKSQLVEDYLTCPICFNSYTKPKALPCLHTFCEGCLRDYIVSRNYENLGSFPCPVCRTNTTMPTDGVEGFPDNHLMSSLSDTVAHSQDSKPKPKPRRSLGQPQEQRRNDEKHSASNFGSSSSEEDTDLTSPRDVEPNWEVIPKVPMSCSDEMAAANSNPELSHPGMPKTSLDSSTSPQTDEANFSKGNLVTQVQPPPYSYHPQFTFGCPQPIGQAAMGGIPPTYGWDIDKISGNSQSNPHNPKNSIPIPCHISQNTSQALYPSVPMHNEECNVACTEFLLLRFGKQGSSNRDFLKPIGLTISMEGNYVVSDSSVDKNKIFIFNTGGELITAFNCGCKVKDVTMNKNNEILAAVHKNVSGIRHFTLLGQCKGEYGKFFTFEEPCGIGVLENGGAVISGTQNQCLYILTSQMKLAAKIGRKGNGDGYFQHPGFIAVDSKNNIIVTDKINNCIQVFNAEGKFKLRFGSSGKNHGQLDSPLGVCVDNSGNIIVADSGNFRVEVFSSKGQWLRSVVTNTEAIGSDVKPVNVAFTPTGNVAVLLRGPYFAEVRVYSSDHKHLVQNDGLVSALLSSTSALWYTD